MACPATVGMPMRAMVDDIVIAAHGTHATEDGRNYGAASPLNI